MIIFRYLTKQIFSSFFATTMVLLVIFLSNQLVHTLNEAASGKLTVHAVLMMTLVQLPILLSYMLPSGLFLGILLTLGRLYVDHEMVVLSACGLSKAQIVRMIMTLALVLTLFSAWLMLSVQPYLSRLRVEIISRSAQTATLEKILAGRFQQVGDDNHVIYAGTVDKSRPYFGDIFVAMRGEINERNRFAWHILSSDSVSEQQQINNGNFFVFDQGYRYSGVPGEKSLKELKFGQFWQRLPNSAGADSGRYSAMSTGDLINAYSDDAHAAAELQWRIVNVLSVLLFALLAIPLSEVNPRKGKFAQMLPAILIYVAYANLMFASKSWVKNEKIASSIGMWWIVLLLLLLALFLFWGKTGWSRLMRRF